MPRVIGIDPGTVSIDLCGLDDGRLFLERSWPTAEALADPARLVGQLEAAGPLDLVAGPSGYGLPLTRVQDATEEDLLLAFLAAPGETGGIGGLRGLVRALARSPARSRISQARCPRRCCSGAARPPSPVGMRRPPRPSGSPGRRRPRSRSPAMRWSRAR